MSDGASWPREADRQRAMLCALWRREADAALAPWLRDDAARGGQGLAAYRGNAAAIAERALTAAYPTMQQLIGDASFDALARAFWHRHPPSRGDLAHWGGDLAAFVEADAQLAGEPYLADVARLEWAVHRIEHAADAPAVPDGLPLLATTDPALLTLQFQHDAQLLRSRWPVASLWHAHRADANERAAAVRAAWATQRGECAWVWRNGWQAAVRVVVEAEADFLQIASGGGSLGAALEAAGDAFDFAAWLGEAITRHTLVAVRTAAPAPTQAGR
jgi:hypothetical protein